MDKKGKSENAVKILAAVSVLLLGFVLIEEAGAVEDFQDSQTNKQREISPRSLYR